MIFKKWAEMFFILLLSVDAVAWLGAMNYNNWLLAAATTVVGLIVLILLGVYGRGDTSMER